ncbi:MAG: hypothetical protein IJT50_07280 [Lentisphaeria bacterium]|nr:hypothetical protein [Lentisphaeria bacterium]
MMLTCGKFRILAIGLCALCVSLSLAGAPAAKRPLFGPVNVDMKFLLSPRIKAGSTNFSTKGRLSLYNNRWGVIEITYTPRFDYEGARKRNVKATGEWLNDVVLGIQVIVRDSMSNTRRPLGAALLSTRAEFWSIALDGKDHVFYMYIPPQIIERCMPTRDGRTVNTATTKDFLICVTFYHKEWGVLAKGYYGAKERRPGDEFNELVKTVPTSSVFHGAILSRARSPWGVNDMDQYDLEKPTYMPPPLDAAAINRAAPDAEESGDKGGARNAKKGKKSKQ